MFLTRSQFAGTQMHPCQFASPPNVAITLFEQALRAVAHLIVFKIVKMIEENDRVIEGGARQRSSRKGDFEFYHGFSEKASRRDCIRASVAM